MNADSLAALFDSADAVQRGRDDANQVYFGLRHGDLWTFVTFHEDGVYSVLTDHDRNYCGQVDPKPACPARAKLEILP